MERFSRAGAGFAAQRVSMYSHEGKMSPNKIIGNGLQLEKVSAMFAIFEDGSHQYQVQVGDKLAVDYRETANPGDTLTFERVLLANDGEKSAIGQPTIEGAVVEAEVLDQIKGKKLEIVKYRRRKNSRTHTGHRQKYTEIQVNAITVEGMVFTAPVAEAAPPVEEPPAAEEESAEVATAETAE